MNAQNLTTFHRHYHALLHHTAVLGLTIMVLTACSGQSKPSTQLVAKVNNDEITIHQLNNAVAKLSITANDDMAAIRQELLSKLINEQLTVQQAIRAKLDRSPEVVMQIEAARREILTKAYLKQVVAGLPKIKPEEMKRFYADNAPLFTDRHIYNLQQILLVKPHPPLDEIKALTAEKSMNEILAVLKEDNIAFSAKASMLSAEDISPQILAKLTKLNDGEMEVIETPTAIVIVKRDSSVHAPLNSDTAMQRIPQYLMNEQARVAISDKLNTLKSQATITFLNEFAVSDNLATNIPNAPEKKPETQDSIAKGIAGVN